MYVDVHCHLTHEKFEHDCDAVIAEAEKSAVGAIIVNGLDPISNRGTLALAAKYSIVGPALGVYPVYAVNHLAQNLSYKVPIFDVSEEIRFIEASVQAGSVVAIGECGLDGYWVGENTYSLQESVFEELIEISMRYQLPIIVHSRKLESRTLQILRHHHAPRVIMHCFGGKVNLALAAAANDGYFFSIPPNAARNEAFQKMLKELPLDRILTETDAPYLSPTPSQRNVPANVRGTVQLLANFRGLEEQEARHIVWKNYEELFTRESQA